MTGRQRRGRRARACGRPTRGVGGSAWPTATGAVAMPVSAPTADRPSAWRCRGCGAARDRARRGTARAGSSRGSRALRACRGSTAWRSSSNMTSAIFTAPTPSVMAWWIFMMIAALPSARSSTTVNSHSGRARSKPCMAIGSARSSTDRSRAVAAGPHEAQVEVEVEVGVDLPAGRRDRQRVAAHPLAHAGHESRAALDQRSRTASRSGAESRIITAVIVERSIGSFSIAPHQRVAVAHPRARTASRPSAALRLTPPSVPRPGRGRQAQAVNPRSPHADPPELRVQVVQFGPVTQHIRSRQPHFTPSAGR